MPLVDARMPSFGSMMALCAFFQLQSPLTYSSRMLVYSPPG